MFNGLFFSIPSFRTCPPPPDLTIFLDASPRCVKVRTPSGICRVVQSVPFPSPPFPIPVFPFKLTDGLKTLSVFAIAQRQAFTDFSIVFFHPPPFSLLHTNSSPPLGSLLCITRPALWPIAFWPPLSFTTLVFPFDFLLTLTLYRPSFTNFVAQPFLLPFSSITIIMTRIKGIDVTPAQATWPPPHVLFS